MIARDKLIAEHWRLFYTGHYEAARYLLKVLQGKPVVLNGYTNYSAWVAEQSFRYAGCVPKGQGRVTDYLKWNLE